MGVMKPYLITVFLLLVIVDVALARYYYRWFRFGRFARQLRRCNQQSILDKLCPEVPEDDPCANIDCSCRGTCQNGDCTCEPGFTGDNCENDPCANIDCSCRGTCHNGDCTCEPGFTGENCESEDVCTLPDFCMNGATCENNECTCTAQFTGERCEFCTEFVSTDETGFQKDEFKIIPPVVEGVTSCIGLCNSDENCTAFTILDGDCCLFGSPVLQILDLAPLPGLGECENFCLFTEDCLVAVQEANLCYLLNTTIITFEFFGGSSVKLLKEQCNL